VAKGITSSSSRNGIPAVFCEHDNKITDSLNAENLLTSRENINPALWS
jgi:hypothetical protein